MLVGDSTRMSEKSDNARRLGWKRKPQWLAVIGSTFLIAIVLFVIIIKGRLAEFADMLLSVSQSNKEKLQLKEKALEKKKSELWKIQKMILVGFYDLKGSCPQLWGQLPHG